MNIGTSSLRTAITAILGGRFMHLAPLLHTFYIFGIVAPKCEREDSIG